MTGCLFRKPKGRLALADAKHLGAAGGALTLSRGPAVLQGYILWILDLALRPALHTISLSHDRPPDVVWILLRQRPEVYDTGPGTKVKFLGTAASVTI